MDDDSKTKVYICMGIYADLNNWFILRLMLLYFYIYSFSSYLYNRQPQLKNYNCLLVGKINYLIGIGALIQITVFILHISFVLNEIKIYYAKKELIEFKKMK